MEEDHLERVRHVDLELLEQAARGDAGRTQVVNQPGLEIQLPYVPRCWLSLAQAPTCAICSTCTLYASVCARCVISSSFSGDSGEYT